MGLGYLNLGRRAETLSGGEAQRIRLASQIGSGLVGVMYVLDEPSIGLHQRDQMKLIGTLTALRDLGNTVVVVEHDEDTMLAADQLIDMGPGAGVEGGEVISQGSPDEVKADSKSLTGRYLSGKDKIHLPKKRLKYDPTSVLRICGANLNNLKGEEVRIPHGLLTCVTGVSGSGKSSLINRTMLPALNKLLNKNASSHSPMGNYHSITGATAIDKIIAIDQSPIGRTPRSNPATYTGMFTTIRELFANVEEARVEVVLVGLALM